jgi:hypothetical protein
MRAPSGSVAVQMSLMEAPLGGVVLEPHSVTVVSGKSTRNKRWTRRFRWTIFVVLVVLGFLAVLITYLVPSARVCWEVADQTGVAALCQPLGTRDAVLEGAYLLVASLFIWPDLAEVSLGFFRMRKVADGAKNRPRARRTRNG